MIKEEALFNSLSVEKPPIQTAGEPVITSLPENCVLAHKKSDGDKLLMNITNYQKLEGKLIYLTMTRPDISYVVHCLSQYLHALLKSHFDISLRVFRYLKLADVSLYRVPGQDVASRRSVSGYCVFVNGCLVSWKSKKHATLSRSSMTYTTCEIMWILKVLKDSDFDKLTHVALCCDNKSVIQIAANPVMHEKTKHFDIDVHLVREKFASGLIIIEKVDLKNQMADILTKALGSAQHTSLTKKLGMVNLFVS
ncbi:ribonuclease H-like domain-containing protein [Tanacetum coccineum]